MPLIPFLIAQTNNFTIDYK